VRFGAVNEVRGHG